MNNLSLFAPFLDIFWVLETYTQIVFVCIICRMRFCCPDGCVTQTCWRLDWCSARAVSSGCCVLSWATVRVTWNSQNTSFFAHPSLVSFPSHSGSADSLLRSCFPDGMSESLIAYLLYGVLRALEYLHHMGYVHRWAHDDCFTETRDPADSGLLTWCVLQGCEGESRAAVSWRPCVSVGSAERVQSDEGW